MLNNQRVFSLKMIPMQNSGRSPFGIDDFFLPSRPAAFLQVKTSARGSEKLKTLQKRPDFGASEKGGFR
jgi:hypothetical protein